VISKNLTLPVGAVNCRCPYCGRGLAVLDQKGELAATGRCRHFRSAQRVDGVVHVEYGIVQAFASQAGGVTASFC
jgi:hypothetical protein